MTPTRKRVTGTWCAVAAVMLVLPSAALSDRPPDTALGEWRQFTPPGKNSAVFTVREETTIEVEADAAVSFLYAELSSAVGHYEITWRWRVDRAPGPSNLAVPGMDDRPLAVHVWFPRPSEDIGFWDDLMSVFGVPLIGHAITYVWGGTADRGDIITNPHIENGVLFILRDGDTPHGTWYRESVDVTADFENAFGYRPSEPPRYIVISSDTDDKGGQALGAIDDLRFGALAP